MQDDKEVLIQEQENKQKKRFHDLLRTMRHVFFAIIQVDVLKDLAYVLQSRDFPERAGEEFSWKEYQKSYMRVSMTEEIKSFSSYSLWKLSQSGQRYLSKEISYITENTRAWLTVDAFIEGKKERPYATILIRESTREHLQKSIIDLYVYNKCDYFIYLDVGKNSYVSFGDKEDKTMLLPEKSDNYSAEMANFVRNYVVTEDRARALCEIGLLRVQKQLENAKVHSFNCGVMEKEQGYTRKQFEYQYYDRLTGMILLSCTDITDLYLETRKRENELKEALERAHTDLMTGLLNHQGVVERISAVLQEEDREAVLMFIDMDDFKSVNDSLGHIEGDKLLCKTADILRQEVGSEDFAGRIGGDEFVIFFGNAPSMEIIENTAKRICKRIHQLSLEFYFPVGCSIGVAVSPRDGKDYLTLTECADKRLYYSKAKGKNTVTVSEEDKYTPV